MTPPRLLLAAAVVTALTVLTGSLVAGSPARPGRPEGTGRAAVSGAGVLRAWDERRSRAWAAGDPGALRSLYTAGSRAGRADRSMLRRWSERGLRVEGLRMQVLAVRVRARSPVRLVLLVTDRVAGGVAVGRAGVRVHLPRDRASTREVTLRLVAGEWRVGRVTPA